jgi:hypothetical protein
MRHISYTDITEVVSNNGDESIFPAYPTNGWEFITTII